MKRALLPLAAATCLAAVACLFGSETISRAQETANKPALPGGFAPLVRGRSRALSYGERDREPIDTKNPWLPVQADGYHDPNSDAIDRLQNPAEAMRSLPRAGTGDFVEWVAALEIGVIEPRAEVGEAGQMKVLDLDVMFRATRPMPTVTFSHSVHTKWLACSNCHDALFKRKTGASEIGMIEIFRGKACGICHGKVAFPPDQCLRCHNGPRRKAEN